VKERVVAHLVGSVLVARGHERAGALLARLAAERPACLDLVLLADEQGRLAGALPLERLLRAAADETLGVLADPAYPRVHLMDDQERAANLALHHAVDALAVVDEAGKPLGVMPAQAIMQVLRREHVEDLHRFTGIHREEAKARHAIEDPPLRQLRHRLPWLLAGLAGSALATAAMAGFESTLSENIAVAFFIPGIVYLADAIGTQSEAIAVRGLSLTRAGIGHLVGAEIRTGLLIGACLGAASFVPIWLVFDNVRLAAAVCSAIFAAGSIAAALGILLPWALARGGRDPALGSGPIATVIQDILSVIVYLGVVAAFRP
jgi:magnesium transporter